MIGREPIVDDMLVTKGEDFTHYFGVTDDSPFPDGTTVTLYIYSHDQTETLGFWPAVLVEAGGARVQIDSDDLDPIPDGSRFRVYVTYPGSSRVCWYRGAVWRKD